MLTLLGSVLVWMGAYALPQRIGGMILTHDTVGYNDGFTRSTALRSPPKTLAVGSAWLAYGSLLAWFLYDPTAWIPFALYAIMLGLRTWERSQWADAAESIRLGAYAPSLAVLLGAGVLLGLTDGDVATGWEGACGVLGGCYFLAGLSKVKHAGSRWFSASNLPLLLVERAHGNDDTPVRRARLFIATRPKLAAGLAATALLVQLSGPLFAFEATRTLVAIPMILQFVGFAILLGYREWEWIYITIGLWLITLP